MNEEYDVQEPVTNVTENTDAQTVEEDEEGIELTDTTDSNNEDEKTSVKTYTEEDLEKIVNQRINDILPTKIEREKRKMERDYREKLAKFEETDSILKAGLGTKDITESNQRMREFYEEQGVKIPSYQPKYSDEDEKALGELEASKVIKLGYEEMQEEANRLADIGTDKMSVRERAMFSKLATELTSQKNRRELAQLGVKEDVLDNENFKQFSKQFTKEVPIKTIYEMYSKINQKSKKYEQIGSMKNKKTSSEVKDYYTPEEANKFTRKDYDKNPKLLEAVEKSMTLWGN